MLNVRDMFYRHKAAGMLNYWSLGRALGTAEHRFILIASFLFCIMFIPVSGVAQNFEVPLRVRAFQAFSYWGFFTFNSAIYSYIGQLFMCLVRGQGTAMVLASIFIGINNFFINLTSAYVGQNSTVYENGVCEVMDDGSYCTVPVNEFVYAFFGQQYGRRNIGRNVIILACILVGVRIFTFLALRNLTYSGK